MPFKFHNITLDENVFRKFGVVSCLQKDRQADVSQYKSKRKPPLRS